MASITISQWPTNLFETLATGKLNPVLEYAIAAGDLPLAWTVKAVKERRRAAKRAETILAFSDLPSLRPTTEPLVQRAKSLWSWWQGRDVLAIRTTALNEGAVEVAWLADLYLLGEYADKLVQSLIANWAFDSTVAEAIHEALQALSPDEIVERAYDKRQWLEAFTAEIVLRLRYGVPRHENHLALESIVGFAKRPPRPMIPSLAGLRQARSEVLDANYGLIFQGTVAACLTRADEDREAACARSRNALWGMATSAVRRTPPSYRLGPEADWSRYRLDPRVQRVCAVLGRT